MDANCGLSIYLDIATNADIASSRCQQLVVKGATFLPGPARPCWAIVLQVATYFSHHLLSLFIIASSRGHPESANCRRSNNRNEASQVKDLRHNPLSRMSKYLQDNATKATAIGLAQSGQIKGDTNSQRYRYSQRYTTHTRTGSLSTHKLPGTGSSFCYPGVPYLWGAHDAHLSRRPWPPARCSVRRTSSGNFNHSLA